MTDIPRPEGIAPPDGADAGRLAWLRTRSAGERIAAGLLGVLCAVMFAASLGYGVWTGKQPGAGLFPAIVSGGLLILATCWFVLGERTQHAGEGGAIAELEDEAEQAEDSRIDRAGVRTIVFAVAWALVPIILFDKIGFFLTSTLYVSGLLIVVAKLRWWLTLPITAVVTVLVAVGADRIGIVLPDPFHLLRFLGV